MMGIGHAGRTGHVSEGHAEPFVSQTALRPPSAPAWKPQALGIGLAPLPWPSACCPTEFTADNNWSHKNKT